MLQVLGREGLGRVGYGAGCGVLGRMDAFCVAGQDRVDLLRDTEAEDMMRRLLRGTLQACLGLEGWR